MKGRVNMNSEIEYDPENLIEKEELLWYGKSTYALCAALAIGLTAIATAWAQSRIGLQEQGHGEKPELRGHRHLVAIPERW